MLRSISLPISAFTLSLLLISILLSASSQIMLKVGMTTAGVRAATSDGGVLRIVVAITRSPGVVAGLLCFGLSAVVWLFVLSRMPVSQAYPCVALGIVITSVAGGVLLGEPLTPTRMIGIAIIVAGVVLTGFN